MLPFIKKRTKVFDLDPNDTGIPIILKAHRLANYGKTEDKLFELFLQSSSVGSRIGSNLYKLQFLEPILTGFMDDLIGPLTLSIEMILTNYSAAGVVGQIKNIEELLKYFPDYKVGIALIDEAYFQLDARNEILDILKNEGAQLKKDLLPRLKHYPNLRLPEYFFNCLIGNGSIKKGKKGRFVEFSL